MAKKIVITLTVTLFFLPCVFASYTTQSGTQFELKWTVTTPVNSKFEILEFSKDENIPDNTEIPLEFVSGNQRVCKVQYTTNDAVNITFTCKSTVLKTDSNKKIPYTLKMSYGNDTNSLYVGTENAEYAFPNEDLFTIAFPGGIKTESLLVWAEMHPPGESDPDPLPGIYRATITFGVSTP